MSDKTWNLFQELMRNHPLWPCTFSMCKCGREAGRGGGKCRICLVEELSEIVGPELANRADEVLANVAMAWNDIHKCGDK